MGNDYNLSVSTYVEAEDTREQVDIVKLNAEIEEIVKLEKGVAAVSQIDWLEPVLCKIDKYIVTNTTCPLRKEEKQADTLSVTDSLLQCIMTKELYRKGDRVDLINLRDAIVRSSLETKVKCEFIEYIDAGKDEAISKLRSLVYDFLHAESAIEKSKHCSTITEWANCVADNLEPSIGSYSKNQIDLALALIIYEQSRSRGNLAYIDIYHSFTDMYRRNGGVV